MWFPQGTRHPKGDADGAKSGLGQVVLDLARDYGVKTTIIPTALRYVQVGSMRPWPPMSGLRGFVRYDDPMDYDDLLNPYLDLDPEKDASRRREIQQAFCDRVMDRVAGMLREMETASKAPA